MAKGNGHNGNGVSEMPAAIAKPSSLLELLRQASPVRRILKAPEIDLGLAEVEPFPFLAIVGQEEMKLALILNIINPRIGGVLLIGARGTAKSTAVRALPDLLPTVEQSLCPDNMGCNEEKLEAGSMDALCPACQKRVGYGEPLTRQDRVRLVELPLNARLDDVVGKINERLALEKNKIRLEQGILAQADGNILYIDEVNLLDGDVSDAILDAAAQGYYVIRRGAHNLTYHARFSLIGSMNPEEGFLRPQLMDRFGLRVVVDGIQSVDDRYRVYEMASWYSREPDGIAAVYAEQTLALAAEVEAAIGRLPAVTLTKEAKKLGLTLTQQLKIASNRADITLFEAARAHAAAAGRTEATARDIQTVALFSLRLRQSPSLQDFFQQQATEDKKLLAVVRKNMA